MRAPADIDTINFYDSFTLTVLLLLEDLGFCPKGDGGKFVQERHLHRCGDLPLNTEGGVPEDSPDRAIWSPWRPGLRRDEHDLGLR